MAKRFKLKFSRVITSFNSCRSKDPSALPSNPVPSFLRLSHVELNLPPPPLPPPPPSSKPCNHSSIKRHMSSALASLIFRFRLRSPPSHSPSPPPPPPPDFHWEQEDKWHVVAKIFDDSSTTPRRKIYTSLLSGDNFHNINNRSTSTNILVPPKTERKSRRSRKKKKVTPRVLRISTSSADSGMFSSEGIDDDEYGTQEDDIENDETETLVSSTRSVSTDYNSAPEFSPHLEIITESPFNRVAAYHRNNKKKVKKAAKRPGNVRNGCDQYSSSSPSPARLSRFQWLIPCMVEGKVRESFAVVKKSEDPHEDFKRSMMEMIMEKQMFEVKDLEQLLQCFLSLNSRDHHGAIVEAFCEIWEALFSDNIANRVSGAVI